MGMMVLLLEGGGEGVDVTEANKQNNNKKQRDKHTQKSRIEANFLNFANLKTTYACTSHILF